MSKQIIYKTPEQIANIRQAGKHLTELLIFLRDHAQPDVSLIELDALATQFLQEHQVKSAFYGYEGFPAQICLSVNECVVHGIPDSTILQKGDLLKIDAGTNYQGGIADSAVSLVVGGDEHNPEGAHLIETTKGALDHALQYVFPGGSLFDFGKAVHDWVSSHNCSVIKNLTGHGVGVAVHEGPAIYNWPNAATQQYSFEPGMVVALEPITAITSNRFVQHPHNERNLYTEHNDLGAQREYTVLITDQGHEILAGIV